MNRKATNIQGIYEYDNGTYFVRVTKKCLNGKIIEKSKKVATLAEALAVKAELCSVADNEAGQENKFSLFSAEKSFAEYVSWYLNELVVAGNRKKSVVESDSVYFNSVILPVIGSIKLNQISRQTIYFFLSELANAKTKFGNPYSNHSQKRAYVLLRSAIRFAVKRSIISSDPTENIDCRFNSPIQERAKEALNINEVNSLIEKAKEVYGLNVAAILAVGFTTGARMCELAALVPEDIDFENQLINVNKSVYLGRVSNTTKNKTHNQVPLLPNVAAILDDYMKVRDKKVTTLFYGERNKNYISVTTINPILKKLCIQLGFPVISCHGMRRTLNSILINSNVSPLTTAKILNHKSINMTYHYYKISGAAKLNALSGAFNVEGKEE